MARFEEMKNIIIGLYQRRWTAWVVWMIVIIILLLDLFAPEVFRFVFTL